MGIFKNNVTPAFLNKLGLHTLIDHLGIVITTIGHDFVEAEMPVDHRTHQPQGLLHGGASVALAESLGSMAAYLCIDIDTHLCVGLEINANHVKGVKDGFVTGRATPIHIGKSTQIWDIRITKKGTTELVCISRITMAILAKR